MNIKKFLLNLFPPHLGVSKGQANPTSREWNNLYFFSLHLKYHFLLYEFLRSIITNPGTTLVAKMYFDRILLG